MTVLTRHTIPLPWQSPPLSLNSRHGNRYAENRLVQQVKEQTGWASRAARTPLLTRRVSVELHWRPAVERHRDYDNLMGTYKPCVDGLVLAGVLVGDDYRYVGPPVLVLHDSGMVPSVWLELVELPDGRLLEP